MDLRCPRCGEPWEFDTLHEEAALRYAVEYGDEHTAQYTEDREMATTRYEPIFKEVSQEFRAMGCRALHEFRGTDVPCQRSDSELAGAASVLYDLLGDDLDGAAAMLEDFEGGYF